MEHDGCCFIAGAGAAGMNHLSGADAAAVRTAAVQGIGHHSIPPVVSGPYRSGGRHFPCAGGARDAVLGGDADSYSAGDGLVSKVWQDCQPLLSDNLVKKSDRVR